MKKKATQPEREGDFASLVTSIVEIHQQAQEFATKAVNIGLTLRNWLIGRRIVEFEQKGLDRVTYGQRLLPELANKLASAGLKRVGTRELRRFRLFYTVYPQIRETVSPESEIVESLTPQSIHRLSFSHQNLGQLNTYVAYYKKHEMTLGDQPPVGILLCTRKNEALVEFALGDIPNQLFVSRYAVEMPDKKEIETFLRQIGKDIHNEDE